MKSPEPSAKKGCFYLIIIIIGIATCTTFTSTPDPVKSTKEQQIEAQFSKWDGSHRYLTKSVKKSLKDPDSYTHVTTTYNTFDDYIEVYMTYSARNSFGGIVTEQAKGTFDLKGNVIEIQHL
tara:strand:- start:30 stop:395 length:366 start_codon:yes stop_codon:yes gene_type:complete